MRAHNRGAMNPDQQRKQGTAVTRANQRIDALAECVDQEVSEKMTEARALVSRLVGEERTFRLKLADEQRAYVDARDRELRVTTERLTEALAQRLTALETMTFWQQLLRWMFKGRR